MDVPELFVHLNSSLKKIRSGDQNAEEEFFRALTEAEEHTPAMLDRAAIAAWVSKEIVENARARGTLTRPEQEYRVRIEQAAKRIRHPLMLTVLPDVLRNSGEDPIVSLNEMLNAMGL